MHFAPPAQLPQLRVPPQPSGVVPQFIPRTPQFVGVQNSVPPQMLSMQTLLTHDCPLAQVPQLTVPPQSSETLPQLSPLFAHVFCGVQQTLLMQGAPFGQLPQFMLWPVHGSVSMPQAPRSAQLDGQSWQL